MQDVPYPVNQGTTHPNSVPVLPVQSLGIQVMPKPQSSGWALGYFMLSHDP